MDNNALRITPEERHRFQVRVLPMFDDIAQAFLHAVTGDGSTSKLSTPLDYLDGKVDIDGVLYRRRQIILAIHDMKDELEVPLALQSKVLAKCIFLKLRPIPHLRLYRDIATAILRIEMVIRWTATQAHEAGAARPAARQEETPAGEDLLPATEQPVA